MFSVSVSSINEKMKHLTQIILTGTTLYHSYVIDGSPVIFAELKSYVIIWSFQQRYAKGTEDQTGSNSQTIGAKFPHLCGKA